MTELMADAQWAENNVSSGRDHAQSGPTVSSTAAAVYQRDCPGAEQHIAALTSILCHHLLLAMAFSPVR